MIPSRHALFRAMNDDYPPYPGCEEKPLVLETALDPQISIVWLHGLGSNCVDFSEFCKVLPIYKAIPVRFIIPQAPVRSVTFQLGMTAPSWYDIFSVQQSERHLNFEDLQQTKNYVLTLIQRQVDKGVSPDKIFLGGFSQGGAVSLETAFSLPYKIGGILSLSGYLPSPKIREAEHKAPVFFAYGLKDAMIPLVISEKSYSVLQSCGFSISKHVYKNMDHDICPQEILDINDFLIKIYNR